MRVWETRGSAMRVWDHSKGVLNRWNDPDVDLDDLVSEYLSWIEYYMACYQEFVKQYGV